MSTVEGSRKLLLTAFEPFGGAARNAALEVLRRMPASCGGFTVVALTVPTVFYGCVPPVTDAIVRERPDAVLCMGQAAGRSALTPERAAVNRMDARIADNAGFRPKDLPIEPDGPAAYVSTLPVLRMTEAIRARQLPAELSDSAGTFVCNRLFYGVMHFLAARRIEIPAGFLHLPCAAPGQSEPLPLDALIEGVCAAISAI